MSARMRFDFGVILTEVEMPVIRVRGAEEGLSRSRHRQQVGRVFGELILRGDIHQERAGGRIDDRQHAELIILTERDHPGVAFDQKYRTGDQHGKNGLDLGEEFDIGQRAHGQARRRMPWHFPG